MDKDRALEMLKEGVFYLTDEEYTSESLIIKNGYSLFGDNVFQVNRIDMYFNHGIVDIFYYLTMDEDETGHDILLVELRGLDVVDENGEIIDIDGIYYLGDSLTMTYDPGKKYTVKSIEKLLVSVNKGIVSQVYLDEISRGGHVFLHWDTWLGKTPYIYSYDKFVKIMENRLARDKEKREKKDMATELVDNSMSAPIYEIWEYEDDERTLPKKTVGLFYNKDLDKVTQFVMEDGNEYSRDEYYFYYNDKGDVKEVVKIKSIPLEYARRYKFVIDKNYLSDNSLKLSEADYIRSLFKDIDDQDFISNTWEKLSVIRDKEEIDKFEIHEYEKYELVSILSNGTMTRRGMDEEDDDD